jgi:capsular exopolysaccharide synthesis family protein
VNTPLVTNLLRALLRWWWLIALSLVLSVGVAYLLRSEQEELFMGQATIIIGNDPNNPGESVVTVETMEGYVALIRRNSILQPVINDLGLEVSVGELTQRMDVGLEPLTGLIYVSIIDNDAERAARIANAIVQEMIEQTSSSATVLDLDFINNQIEDIQRQVTELQREYNRLVEDSAGLTSAFDLQQNLEQRRSIESTILDLRSLLLELVANAPQSALQLFEPAVPDFVPVASNSIMDLVFAGAGGGILAAFLVLLFTFFDDRIQWNEHQHDSILGQRVLGPLGIIPQNRLPLYVDTMSNSVEAEALRQVRAKITLAAGGTFPKVLTVLSYDSGEGKTLTSSNLALETAHSGLRTLVIDGDMRRGDLHEIFRMPNIYGLSDLLGSSQPLPELLPKALLDSGYENLTLLPFGRTAADPASLLSGPRWPRLVEILCDYYEAIIIDAAPTIGGSDSVFLGEVSSGVVIVVNARRTRLKGLQQTIDNLREGNNINILGIAVNRVRLQVTSRYNNYYYRQSPGVKPQRISHQMKHPSTGLRSLFSHVSRDSRTGELMLSLRASADRLGVRKQTIIQWIDSGYLQAEKRFLRRWIRMSNLDRMLDETLSRSAVAMEVEPEVSADPEAHNANGSKHLPDTLRQQREAILGFANRPDVSDSEG